MSTTPTFNFLLKQYPYLSRVGKQTDDAKNYYAVAFKPGYALQASELNEMQELQYIQQTLTQTMISNWCTHDIINSAAASPTVTGPGWNGCTPLHPDLITLDGGTLNIKEGWYLFKNTATFGVWAYNKTLKQLSLSLNPTQYGFYAEHSIVECTSTTETATTDLSLQDTSNINVINGKCGASRLKLTINTFVASSQSGQGLFYSVLTGDSKAMKYINNLGVGG
jgi:hypothetical protein